MELDVFILATVLTFLVIGAFQGLVAQAFRLAGAVVAALVGGRLGIMLARAVESYVPLSQATLALAAILAAAVAIYVAFALTGHLLTRLLKKSKPLGGVNRTLGGVLGGAKAVLVWFALLSIATGFDLEGWRIWGDRTAGDVARSSYAFRLAARYNPLGGLSVLRRVETVQQRLATPEGHRRLAAGPAFRALASNPKVKAVLGSPDIQKALEERRVIDLMSDPRVEAMLGDPEVRALARDFLLEVAEPDAERPPGGVKSGG